MSKSKPSLPKGTRDFGPVVSAKRNYLIDRIKENFKRFGFSQIETPTLENLSTLTGKYGDEGDQLLFKVLNSGDYLSKSSVDDFTSGSKQLTGKISEKGLRYDLTVPFARYVVMNQNDIAFPFKRYQIQPVWRADRPQKGRYREFYQCDADIIGSKNIWSEVELVLLINSVFNAIGLKDFVIKINHRDVLFKMAAHAGLEGKEIPFCTEIDKLDKVGREKVIEKLLETGANKEKLVEVMDLMQKNDIESLGSSSIISTGEGSKQLLSLDDMLIQQSQLVGKGLNYEIDYSLARGLSYYTGIIFEVKPTTVEMGSICGGGRYDDLTGIFGLPEVSGVGISFGLDRIYDVMEELGLFPDNISQPLQALILHQDTDSDADNFKYGQELVSQLRAAGIRSDLYPEQVKIQKQFKYADKINVPFAIIIGDDERESNTYSLKNMSTGDQQKLDSTQLIKVLEG